MISNLVYILLSVSMFLAFLRLVKGPSLPDRVIALDMISITSIGLIVTFAVANDQPIYLDVAVVLALIAFLGTVAFAYYIEKGEMPWRKS